MRARVIGISGGVGSGKSTVAKMFEKLGAVIIDADKIGHNELNSPAIKSQVCREWGEGILDDDGNVDRKKLGTIVFANGNKEALIKLNEIIHPAILQRIVAQIQELRRRPDIKFIVLDAPLIYESSLTHLCDTMVFVDARKEVRRKRTESQRQWKEDEIEKREGFQLPIETKRNDADYIIDNSKSFDRTFQQVKDIWNKELVNFEIM